MAVLVGMQLQNGEWENSVLSRRPVQLAGSMDVLGRTLPDSGRAVAFDGVSKEHSARLANELRGIRAGLKLDAFKRSIAGLQFAGAWGGWDVYNEWANFNGTDSVK